MVTTTQLNLETPHPYLLASVTDHGWVALAPCFWDEATSTLRRIERLENGEVVVIRLRDAIDAEDGALIAMVESERPLTPDEQKEVRRKIRRMLKLDEDLSDFYSLASGKAPIGPIVRQGRGRLMRSPTLFEDVVKTICTTNITWSQTKAMVERLVMTLGQPYPADPVLRAFPTAEQIAAVDPDRFDETIRLGYRNAYVRELARAVANGDLQLEALDNRSLDPAALRKAIKGIKGVGDYAANTLMMIVGHYGHLAVDSEFRAHVRSRYFDGAETGDKELVSVYNDWGDWKYLAYWFDNYGEDEAPNREAGAQTETDGEE